jgi:hypothetical protein
MALSLHVDLHAAGYDEALPDHADAHAVRCGAHGADAYAASLDHGARFRMTATSSSTRMCAAGMSDATISYDTVHPGEEEQQGSTNRATRTTRSTAGQEHPGNNGRVGTWGNSAPGFAAAGLPDAHPAHKAAYPSAPMIDWYLGDDRHHNGALTLAQTFNFRAASINLRGAGHRIRLGRPRHGRRLTSS